MNATASPHNNSPAKGARRRYPVDFKLKIVRQARESGCSSDIAREHGIPPQTLANWLRAESRGKLRSSLKLGANEIGYLVNLLSTDMKGKHSRPIAQDILAKLQQLESTRQDAVLELREEPASRCARPATAASTIKRRTAGQSVASEWTDEEAAILAGIRKLSPEFRREADRSVQALFRLQLRDMSFETDSHSRTATQ